MKTPFTWCYCRRWRKCHLQGSEGWHVECREHGSKSMKGSSFTSDESGSVRSSLSNQLHCTRLFTQALHSWGRCMQSDFWTNYFLPVLVKDLGLGPRNPLTHLKPEAAQPFPRSCQLSAINFSHCRHCWDSPCWLSSAGSSWAFASSGQKCRPSSSCFPSKECCRSCRVG